MEPPVFHIFIIHHEGLTQRAVRLHGTVQQMRLVTQSMGFVVKPYFIIKPTPTDISGLQDTYQQRIDYEPTGFPTYDKLSHVLSVEELSNYDKHIRAWNMIASVKSGEHDIFMVIEDDTILLQNSLPHFAEAISKCFERKAEWDMVMLGLCHSTHTEKYFQDTRELFPVLPSKEAYLINKQTATTMAIDLLKPVKFPMRIQLSWYIHTHEKLRVLNPSTQVTLDGSKLGLTPCTIHEKNILVFNAEYMELFGYLSQPPENVKANMPAITKLYNSVASMNSPDIMHVYGILLFRAGKLTEAESVLNNALAELQNQQGLLNSRNELLNNIIDMYKDMQFDIDDILKAPSKHAGDKSCKPA